MKFEVIDLLGNTLAIFDNEDEAEQFADSLVNFAYVATIKESDLIVLK
jgi:hypothetical protein